MEYLVKTTLEKFEEENKELVLEKYIKLANEELALTASKLDKAEEVLNMLRNQITLKGYPTSKEWIDITKSVESYFREDNND